MASEVVGSELYRRFGGEGSIIYSGVFKVHDNQCNRCVLVVVIVVVVVLVVGIVVVVVVVGSNSNNSSSGKVDARKNQSKKLF
jgi:heme/copper-type cytochrome/quinol oxidase subunit 2